MSTLLAKLLSVLVPPLCVACREPELSGAAVCDECRRALVVLAPGCRRCGAPVGAPVERCRECAGRAFAFARAWAPFAYDGAARHVVMALKARCATRAADFMAAAVHARAPAGALHGTLVPVPGHPSGARSRGFDHARSIADRLGHLAGLPVADCLVRHGPERPQVGLARAARHSNAHGSVTLRPDGREPPAHVVLVDDVYTTGATLDACATALHEAGTAEVSAVCFARTPRGPKDRWRMPDAARSIEIQPRQRTRGGRAVKIEIRGRNTPVPDALRAHVEERFTTRIGKQVPDLAQLEVELVVERNSSISAGKVAEATLHLKGVTLRAREESTDLAHSVDLVADKLARQVKRHRDKRRGRRDGASIRGPAAPPQPSESA